MTKEWIKALKGMRHLKACEACTHLHEKGELEDELGVIQVPRSLAWERGGIGPESAE